MQGCIHGCSGSSKIINPSFHPFTPWLQLEELPAHPNPSGSGSWAQNIPPDPAKVLGSEGSPAPVVFDPSCKSHLAQELSQGKVLVGISCLNGRNGGKLQQPGNTGLRSLELAIFHCPLQIILCFLLSN